MKKKPLHLIYITGLGDSKVGGQQKAVSTWHWWGVEAELFQMKWADGEAWELKFQRLLARIDAVAADDRDVALVGASAGAGATINAFAARKDVVAGAVLISGKVNRPESIGGSYRRENPAFITSAYDSPAALASLTADDRRRILSRFALADGIVPKADSRIPGAHNSPVPTIGHFFTIATQLTLGAPGFIRFLKKQHNH
jgi:pimeloyl-ACP methyl ester carboxylesterase